MRTPSGTRLSLPLAAVLLLSAAAAPACPFCDGGPDGRNAVHDAIFDDRFWPHLGAAAAPFAVIAGLALVIHGLPTRRRTHGAADGPPR